MLDCFGISVARIACELKLPVNYTRGEVALAAAIHWNFHADLVCTQVLSCVQSILSVAPKAHLKTALGAMQDTLSSSAKFKANEDAEFASVEELLDAMIHASVERIHKDPSGRPMHRADV